MIIDDDPQQLTWNGGKSLRPRRALGGRIFVLNQHLDAAKRWEKLIEKHGENDDLGRLQPNVFQICHFQTESKGHVACK